MLEDTSHRNGIHERFEEATNKICDTQYGTWEDATSSPHEFYDFLPRRRIAIWA